MWPVAAMSAISRLVSSYPNPSALPVTIAMLRPFEFVLSCSDLPCNVWSEYRTIQIPAAPATQLVPRRSPSAGELRGGCRAPPRERRDVLLAVPLRRGTDRSQPDGHPGMDDGIIPGEPSIDQFHHASHHTHLAFPSGCFKDADGHMNDKILISSFSRCPNHRLSPSPAARRTDTYDRDGM